MVIQTLGQSGARTIEAEREQVLELTSIRYSLDKLRTLPFVKDRQGQSKLALHRGFFDIAAGGLLRYDPVAKASAPVGQGVV